MFFFAAGDVALFVHNLCTFGFFCLSIYCLLFIDQKKKKIFFMFIRRKNLFCIKPSPCSRACSRAWFTSLVNELAHEPIHEPVYELTSRI